MAKILVTDDAAFMRNVLRNILESVGHVVDEARTGEECVEILKNSNYDLITMDITMPEMNGITAVKTIREINPEQKIIIVSAMGQKVIVVEAVQAGACDFIVKPFQRENVLAAVDKVLNSY